MCLAICQGEKDIPGLTDTTVPRRLGPKRASRIRKLFNLSKEDDVRQYVVRKPLNKEGKKRAGAFFFAESMWQSLLELGAVVLNLLK